MNSKILEERIQSHFPFDATGEQKKIIKDISEFVSTIGNRSIFLLKGYAGTGKTTLIAALVKSLSILGKRSVLMAPTGKAAKVLSTYSKRKTNTIHRKIYWIRTNKKGNTFIKLKDNIHSNTIFIVDEASMIPQNSEKGFGNRVLLDDLIKYIYSGIDCKLILTGDTAQLPPINLEISPALDEQILEELYNKQVISQEIKHVIRQKENSFILANATDLRKRINNSDYSLPKIITNHEVIKINTGEELQNALEECYKNTGINQTVILCRSNKRASLYNQQIRSKIRWQENEISNGDMVMVVRNNYYWLADEEEGFIANGENIIIERKKESIERYGFRFAKADVRMTDYKKEREIEVILLLDTLKSNTPSISYDDYQKLYNEIALDYKGEKNINKKIKEDRFFNALQIKFAYAITCHKSQGGQWENVFIDLGYFTEDMIDKSYLRWLYTAFTRATKKLYLVNFQEKLFKSYNQ